MKRTQFIYESSRSGKRPRDVYVLETTTDSMKGIDMELISGDEQEALMEAHQALESTITSILDNNDMKCFRRFKIANAEFISEI